MEEERALTAMDYAGRTPTIRRLARALTEQGHKRAVRVEASLLTVMLVMMSLPVEIGLHALLGIEAPILAVMGAMIALAATGSALVARSHAVECDRLARARLQEEAVGLVEADELLPADIRASALALMPAKPRERDQTGPGHPQDVRHAPHADVEILPPDAAVDRASEYDLVLTIAALRERRDVAAAHVVRGPELDRLDAAYVRAAGEAVSIREDGRRQEADAEARRRLRHGPAEADRAIGDFARIAGSARRSLPAVASPNARAGSLAALGERILAIDPDAVDAAGARVDALTRRHLPELVERHGAAARVADLRDLPSLDADLEEGMEGVRASMEDALASMRQETTDELRTQIRFLKARRA